MCAIRSSLHIVSSRIPNPLHELEALWSAKESVKLFSGITFALTAMHRQCSVDCRGNRHVARSVSVLCCFLDSFDKI